MSRCPLPGGTVIWNEPSSLLATVACQPESTLSPPRTGHEHDARRGQRAAGAGLGHLAADQHAALELDVAGGLDRPLGPLQLDFLAQIGLAAGREGGERVIVADGGVDGEPPLVVGAELGLEDAVGVLILDHARRRDHGIGDRPAGVGVEHAALDEPRRLEGDGRLPGGRNPGRVDAHALPDVAEVAHAEADRRAPADARECRSPLVVRVGGPRPDAEALRRVRPDGDAVVLALVVATSHAVDGRPRRPGPASRSRPPAGRARPAPAGAGSRPRASRRRDSARPSRARTRARRPPRCTSKTRLDPCGASRAGTGRRRRPGPGPARRAGRRSSVAATRGERGRAIRSTTAPLTGLPSGPSTRPATVIRPVAAGSGFVVAWADRRSRGRPRRAAGSFTGSSFMASERASQPAPVATAARSSRDIAVSLSLWSSMVRRTSWASAEAGAASAPPAAA